MVLYEIVIVHNIAFIVFIVRLGLALQCRNESQYCDDTMLTIEGYYWGNENFRVFEMKTTDIMLYRYHINIWGYELQ